MLEVVPLIMRALRAEVRGRRPSEWSVPQFRALAFVGRNEGAKLSDLAAFLGLTAPSASKLIDGLVVAKLVSRAAHSTDRRRVSLALTTPGQREYAVMLVQAREFLAAKVAHLAESRRECLLSALRDLQEAFADAAPSEVASSGSKKIRRAPRRVLNNDRADV